MALASSAIATFPPERFTPIMPESTAAARRNAVHKNSPVRRWSIVGMLTGLRCGQFLFVWRACLKSRVVKTQTNQYAGPESQMLHERRGLLPLVFLVLRPGPVRTNGRSSADRAR